MLRVLCARHRPPSCLLSSLFFSSSAASFHRLHRAPSPPRPDAGNLSVLRSPPRRAAAASVWHTILPSYWSPRRTAVLSRHDHGAVGQRGEGSWNVAWDVRPARWLHHPDSVWLVFGVCSTLASMAAPRWIDSDPDSNLEPADRSKSDASCNYRVTGVTADGRCLFRAIAHMACLRNEEEAPDENRQREIADELRAQMSGYSQDSRRMLQSEKLAEFRKVVEELLKMRKEVEWFLEEEFDVYVKRIQQPYAWGGEPELIMCSHVLRTPISVYMKERSSSSLIKIANYGDEYRRNEENSSDIDVLFHGYGHYDILEDLSISKLKVDS